MNVLGSVFNISLGAIAPIAAMIIIGVMARGRARILGIGGAALMLLTTVVQQIVNLLIPVIRSEFDLPIASIGLIFIPFSVLHVIAVILLALAVGTAARDARSAGPAQPAPPQL
ncbi:hypothetical protein ACQCX2_13585 [Propionibacteriaceae bacterium Y1700]|uniref:hypothetical protein n=1 Tax=Microlunatus sp. Y1700 TaxID=3418487 RepID=UPI003DA7A70A